MPRLRRLTGPEVVKILEKLGFKVIRIRGSHHIMRRIDSDKTQTIAVPVHGNKVLGVGLLKRLYRDLLSHLTEDEIKPYFYGE